MTLGKSHADDKAQIAQFSTKDAEKFGEYEAMLNSMVAAVDPLLDHAPPSLYEGLKAKITSGIPILKAGLKLGNEASVFYEMMTAPTTKILNKWFESEPLKATLATDACIGAMISPGIIYLNKIIFRCFFIIFCFVLATPGSGYVLLHHVMGELEGIRGAWGYPEGGMGAVSDAIAKSAETAGAEIVTEATVKKVW